MYIEDVIVTRDRLHEVKVISLWFWSITHLTEPTYFSNIKTDQILHQITKN